MLFQTSASFRDKNEMIEYIRDILEKKKKKVDLICFPELFSSNIYVYTTTGEVIELPNGSTVVDFAYKIHTDIGNSMVAAIVNNEAVSFDYVLENQDRVRIVTDSKAYVPKEEWLNYAKTTTAKSKIREFIKENEEENK